MIVRANNAGDKSVYFNSQRIIEIYEVSGDLFNVFLVGEKIVQIDAKTLRSLLRE